MRKRLRINMILFEIIPIMFYMTLFFILCIRYKAWIAIMIIAPLLYHITILLKNIKNFKCVQNKIDNVGKIIYDDGYVILSNTSVISTKNYFFSVNYKDIKFVYTKKRMFLNNRANSLCIITKEGKKYELIFINWINPFSSKNKQSSEIIKVIKSHNFDVSIL